MLVRSEKQTAVVGDPDGLYEALLDSISEAINVSLNQVPKYQFNHEINGLELHENEINYLCSPRFQA